MRAWLTSTTLGLLLFSTPAAAGSLAGVTLPDTLTVGGQSLVLNGMGLREKYFIDVYVGALYLPAKTTDATKAITDDVPKQITMHMTYDLSKDKLAETMRESIGAAGNAEAKKHISTVAGWMEDVTAGDQIVLRYVPGKGTSVIVKGTTKGTIAGTSFMQAMFGVYLGSKPPTSALKKGLLGG